MKRVFLTIMFLAATWASQAQKMMTREGYIKFFGSTPMENIEAITNQASSVIDVSTNDVVFQVLMNSFTFEKALMQEHFNENYVESEKYPKAVFKGKIASDVKLMKPGTFTTTIEGTMTLHGVEQNIKAPATIIVDKDGIKLSSEFKMAPEDYKIAIPGAVRDKIAKEMALTVKAFYKPVESK